MEKLNATITNAFIDGTAMEIDESFPKLSATGKTVYNGLPEIVSTFKTKKGKHETVPTTPSLTKSCSGATGSSA